VRIERKLVLITGAGSGIGRALAIEAARRRATLVLAGRRAAALEETRGLLGRNAVCSVFPGDITLPAVRRRLREHIAGAWGRLDILVNNAGVISAGAFAAACDRDIESMMATNLVAPIALTRELLPLLAMAAPARVVNIGSMFGDIGYPLFTAYSASKFGLRGFSMALRRELRAFGIGVTYAAPRATRTDAAGAFASLMTAFNMQLDAPHAVAADVWSAVSRNMDSVYPQGWEHVHVLAQYLFPSLVDRAVAKQIKDSKVHSLLAEAMSWIARSEDPLSQTRFENTVECDPRTGHWRQIESFAPASTSR